MSEMRRRRRAGSSAGGDAEPSGRTGIGRKLGIGAAWCLGLFLAANLGFQLFRKDEFGRPQSLLDEDVVAAAAKTETGSQSAAAGIAGTWIGWRSWQRTERASALWTMRTYMVSVVLCIAFSIAVFELDRRWFAVAAAVLFAIQTTLFAIGAWNDQRRHGAHGAHGAPHESSGDGGGRSRAEPAGDHSRQDGAAADSLSPPGPYDGRGGARPEGNS